MKRTSTLSSSFNFLLIFLGLTCITFFSLNTYGQTKNYLTVTPSTGIARYTTVLGIGSENPDVSSTGAGQVDAPGNAAANPSVAAATLKANYFSVLLASFEGEAYIQLKNAGQLTAGTTTYIPFDLPTNNGVNLDLLGVVGDLTGLLSSKVVRIDAYNNADASNDGTKVVDANVTATAVKDVAGRNYFAVTSTVPYNSVRIRLRVRNNLLSLSLGSTINMNVYTAFTTASDNCGSPLFTSVEQSGLNVSLTSLVTNPDRAIDNNLNTFSQIQAGLVGLGTSVSQTIIMNGLSEIGDVAKVTFSRPGSVLTLDLLKTITLRAYNGNNPVGQAVPLNTLLNLDLLGVFSDNTAVPVFFTPSGIFDRIKISIDNTLAVGGNILTGGINIHEVQRTVARPTFTGITGNALTLCGGTELSLMPQSPNAGYTYNFYKKIGVNGPRTLVSGVTGNNLKESGLAAGNYVYYVAAVETGCVAESDLDSVRVTVNPTVVFTTTILSNGMVGEAYTKQIDPATGGVPGYTYALAVGSQLPAGLNISSSGLISGVPSAAGTFTFSVVAKDAAGCTAMANYTLTIAAVLSFPVATLPNGMVGKTYPSTALPSPTGGTTPYTFTAVNAPPGLSLDPATGVFTGTPITAGTYTFPVTVTDADGNTVTTNFTIVVRDVLALTPANLSDGVNGVNYPSQIIPPATGGSGVYTYAVAPNNLPPGLSFDPSTRAITGLPSQSGTFTFPVNVTDSEGNTASLAYTITIKDPLVLGAASLPDGTVNVVYPTQTLPTATGGTGPYTYVGANTPPGLTFDPGTNQISGKPTQSGSFNTTVTVTDATGATVTQNYHINIQGLLVLPGATLANGTVGTPYPTQTLPGVSAGGTSPYTYSVPVLPSGLSFNPATREITGTPTTGGTFTITQTAMDANGITTSTDYTIVIGVADPVVANATICEGSSSPLSVTNVQAGVTYKWYASSGSTSIFTGTVFQTPTLTSTTTYYVQASSGTAISNRVEVKANVNPAPVAAAIITNNQIINDGQTTVLQASATAGNTISWYAAETGGAPLASGSSFTTPILNATTTYYVETQSAEGCVSTTRTAVVVTVVTGSSNPNCNAANRQETGTSGVLCLLCSVQGAGNSTDADPNNFTRITLSVGVGATGYQRLIFQNTGLATDSIRLDLETPTGLLDLNVLNGVTITVLKGTSVVSTYNLNSSLVDLKLQSGNRFKATFVAGGEYDRVEVRFGAVVAALSSLDIYGAEVINPNPTLTAGSQTICSGSTATLAATPNGSTSLAWYSAATGGSLLSSTNTYTTPALTATTTYYIEISKAGCANPERLPVVVTVTPALITPVITGTGTVCAGVPAVLSVTTPQADVTYNWYTAANGGTLLFTGTEFRTPVVNSDITYYVESVNGNCSSSVRTPAALTVSPAPALPQVSASATTINPGQTAILNASSTDNSNVPGVAPVVTFNWYTTATATTPVFTGPTYVTPPLLVNTTYYVEAKSIATGCVSAGRAQIAITVNNGGNPNPVPCEAPTTETNGVTGVALLSGVFNPQLAIDNDTQTGSSLVMTVGALGASVFQSVEFPTLSNVGDTVKLLLSAPGKLLSLGLFSSIKLNTFNGAANNNDEVTVSDPLLVSVELLNGNSQALVSFVPTAQFDKVRLTLNGGLVGALNTIDLNYVQRVMVAPKVASSTVTACAPNTIPLEVVSPIAGITYKWYNAAGTSIGQGVSITSPALTATTKFYVEASSPATGCTSSRTVINVTVTPVPDAPQLLSANVVTCSGSSVVLTIANPQPGLTYVWRDGSNSVVQSLPSATYTITTVSGLATYTVTAQNGCGGASTATTATVNVGATPTPPAITPTAATINSGESAVLIATATTPGATFKWYTTDPTLGGAVEISTVANGQNGTFVTDPILNNGATPILQTYWITSTTGVCTSAAASVVVTILPPASGGGVPCEAATAEEIGTGGPLALLAGVDNRLQAVDNNVNTGSALRIPVGVGSFVYQRVIFTGVSTIGDKVRLKLVSPSKLLTLAVIPGIEVTTYNGAISNVDVMALDNPLIQLEILPGNEEAIIEFTPINVFDRVEVRLNSGLAGALTAINFNYAQRIIAAPEVVAAPATICAGTPTDLMVLNPVGSMTYNWYIDNATTPAASGPTFPIGGLAPGTHEFFVAASRNGCESPVRTKVTVTILAVPDVPVALPGNPTTACANSPAVLGVTQVQGVSYTWYDALTAGNVLATNTSVYTTPSLSPGTYTYYVGAINANGCPPLILTRTAITIVVHPSALPSDITVTGAEKAFCVGTVASLTANSAIGNAVFTWYSDAALTDALFTGPTYTPTVNQNTTYYVTVRGDNKCENTSGSGKAIVLKVNPPATAADIAVAGSSAPFCAGSTANLTASSTTVVNPIFNWYSDAALTKLEHTGLTFNPVVTAAITYYVTVSGDNRCENAAADAKMVTISINPTAKAADIIVTGAEKPFCAGSTVQLNAGSVTVINPVFTWYRNAALTDLLFTGPIYSQVVTATTTFFVTVRGANKCENVSADARAVTVTINPPATAADITVSGANKPFCEGNIAQLLATTTTVDNPVFTWYSDATLMNVVFRGQSFTPTITASTNYYVTVRGDNRCENLSNGGKIVAITVNLPASASDITVTGFNKPFCVGATANLKASSITVINPVFTWYSNAALTNAVFTGENYSPVINGPTAYYVTVRGDNRCESPAAAAQVVAITINNPATDADINVAGAALPICEGETVTLTATSAVVNPIFTWYSNQALTSPITTGATFSPSISATATYYVTVRGDNRCENLSGTGKGVTITVNPRPNVPVIASTGTTICSGDATLLTIQNPQSGVLYEWFTAVTGGSPVNTGATFTTGFLNATIDYFVQATNASNCSSATGRVKVTVNVGVRPQAPLVVSANVNTCLGSGATLSVSNAVAGVTYNWYSATNATVALGSGATFSAPATTTTTTTYYVEAVLGNCANTTRTAVIVTAGAIPTAPPSISGAANPLCSGSTTVLTVNNPDATLKYAWFTNSAGGTALAEGNTFNVPVLNATATYYVGSINAQTNCPSSTRTAVTVNVLTKLNAPVVVVQSTTATSVTFAWSAITGATAYEVSLDGGLTWILPSGGAAGTTHLISGLQPNQKVNIRVRAKGQLDCQLSDATTFNGGSENPLGNAVFVPNTFTPNNDGKNDVLYVYGNSIAKMKFGIYNQWGQFIYESVNVQNGWDGTHKGQAQPNGVYVYLLDLEFSDGTKEIKKGTITILR
ncbi:Ig-like domain-containing protein [Pedobacter nyackensis]|nr:putative Ig domain-containing protein [Pedobacter nyackensis]